MSKKHQPGDVIVDGTGQTHTIRRLNGCLTVFGDNVRPANLGLRMAEFTDIAVAVPVDGQAPELVRELPRPLTLVVRNGEPLGGIEVRS